MPLRESVHPYAVFCFINHIHLPHAERTVYSLAVLVQNKQRGREIGSARDHRANYRLCRPGPRQMLRHNRTRSDLVHVIPPTTARTRVSQETNHVQLQWEGAQYVMSYIHQLEHHYLLEYTTVYYIESSAKFRTNMSLPCSGLKKMSCKKPS
jgi:hypothetical protein